MVTMPDDSAASPHAAIQQRSAAQYAGLTAHEAQVEYSKMNRAVNSKAGQG
jgi:hypothetical protein